MRLARSYLILALIGMAGCGGREGLPELIIPLSTGAALSSPDSPGTGVEVNINGEPAWFVFDTGAGAHMFARWFVEAAELMIDASLTDLSARDATGATVQIQVVHDVVGQLPDGATLPLGTVVVAQFPRLFELRKVGGLLNPQLLAQEATAVVLDLRVPELRMELFDRAVLRLGATILSEEGDLEVCVVTASPIPNKRFAIRVRSGEGEGWLQLDTGADATYVSRASRLIQGMALESGGTSVGVAGRPEAYDVARDLVLTFGGFSVTTAARVVERSGEGCGPDGLLGLDAVGRCALILGSEAVALACSP
jgi:hypothetical protein